MSVTTPTTGLGNRITWRFVRRFFTIALLCLVVAWCLHIFVFSNLHTIIEGKVHRSAQLSPEKLQQVISERKIQTVLNLRGTCLGLPWYETEAAEVEVAGINMVDATLSANRIPPPHELKKIVEVLDRGEYPLLIHCKQGADRTGLVAGLILLLKTDATLERARYECSPMFAHFPILSTRRMDEFFDQYEDWLLGREHTPALFRQWLLEDYRPGPCSAELTLNTDLKSVYPQNQALTFPVLATNLSHETWPLNPGYNLGVQASYYVFTENGQKVFEDRAGRFSGSVPPGKSNTYNIAIPALKQPGKYQVLVDLVAPEHRAFVQHGNRVLIFSFLVQ